MEIILKEKRVKRWGKKAFRYIAPIKDPKEGGGVISHPIHAPGSPLHFNFQTSKQYEGRLYYTFERH